MMTILMKSQCPEDPGRYEHLKEKMSLFLYPERKFLDNTFKTPIFMNYTLNERISLFCFIDGFNTFLDTGLKR